MGLDDARVVGVDLPLDTDRSAYRIVVAFIQRDRLSKGALVTTHKIGVLDASRDLFDGLDRYAELLGEISFISKRKGALVGRAIDAVTGQLALEAFLPREYWQGSRAEAFFLGAGGAIVAITTSLLSLPAASRPNRITITDVDPSRTRNVQEVHSRLEHNTEVRYGLVRETSDTDELVGELPPGSLVANGTGMGKDLPGSHVSNAAAFPENGSAWDYNCRGDFTFLKQAVRSRRTVTAVDGWVYFILGWTQVIAEVFHIDIPSDGPLFDELSEIAARHRREPGFAHTRQ